MNAIEQVVLDTVRAQGKPLHTRAIAELSCLDKMDVSRAVYVLRKEGLLYKDGEAQLPGSKVGRNVALYSACNIDAALAEAIRAAEDPADPEAALDEPTMLVESYEDEAPQAVQVSEYEQANEDPEMEETDDDPICRAIERLSMFGAIPDGRARAMRLRMLAAKLESVSPVVSADLMESASILEGAGA